MCRTLAVDVCRSWRPRGRRALEAWIRIYTAGKRSPARILFVLAFFGQGELLIPPRIDNLYVEQEVVADETTAVAAVLKVGV